MNATTNSGLVLQGVRKAFRNIVAVDDLTFTVPRGSMFGLLGANGAGTLHRRPARDVHQPPQLQATAGGSMTGPPSRSNSPRRACPRGGRPSSGACHSGCRVRSACCRRSRPSACWSPPCGIPEHHDVRLVDGPAPPVRSQPMDAEQLPDRHLERRDGQRVHQQPDRDDPSVANPITIAAFAAYAFAWVPFRGRGILFTIVVALLVVPIQMSLIPTSGFSPPGTCTALSWVSGWRTRASDSRWRIFLLYNTCRSCRGTCWSWPLSMAPHTCRRSCGWSCHCRSRLLVELAISSSCGSGMIVGGPRLPGAGADVRVLPTALYTLIGSRGGSWHS